MLFWFFHLSWSLKKIIAKSYVRVTECQLSSAAIFSSAAYSVNSSITYKLKSAINIHRLALTFIWPMLVIIDATKTYLGLVFMLNVIATAFIRFAGKLMALGFFIKV